MDRPEGMTLEELLEALEEAEAEGASAEGLEIIRLRCPSSFHGEIINGRFLKVPCRGSRCKIPGKKHTDHILDIRTGRFRTVGDERELRSGGY